MGNEGFILRLTTCCLGAAFAGLASATPFASLTTGRRFMKSRFGWPQRVERADLPEGQLVELRAKCAGYARSRCQLADRLRNSCGAPDSLHARLAQAHEEDGSKQLPKRQAWNQRGPALRPRDRVGPGVRPVAFRRRDVSQELCR